jgi:hypothetical protein
MQILAVMSWLQCPTWGSRWRADLPAAHVQAMGAAGLQQDKDGKVSPILETHLPPEVKETAAKDLWATGGSGQLVAQSCVQPCPCAWQQ